MSDNPIRKVFRALVNAYDGIAMSSGDLLKSSTSRVDGLPLLQWKLTGWQSNTWQAPYKYQVIWDVPATLTVQGESSNPDTLLDAICDVDDWSTNVYGLPVDPNGNVVAAAAPNFWKLHDAGKLYYVGDRIVGPYVNRVQMPPNTGDNSYSTCDLIFHVEFIVDNSPAAKAKATVFQLGVNPYSPSKNEIQDGGAVPFTYPLTATADLRAQGAFSKPDTTIVLGGVGGEEVQASNPPIVPDVPAVEGTGNPVKEIVVSPATFTLSVGSPTQQLSAIAFHVLGDSEVPVFTWTSSNTAVATVDSTGLVTRVAAGSVTITASFGGVSGTSAGTVS